MPQELDQMSKAVVNDLRCSKYCNNVHCEGNLLEGITMVHVDSTRMHSSRMRTARTLTVGGGVSVKRTQEIDNSDTI